MKVSFVMEVFWLHQWDQKVETIYKHQQSNISTCLQVTSLKMSPTASQYISLYLRHPFQQHIHERLVFPLVRYAKELKLLLLCRVKVAERRRYNKLLVGPLSITWPWVLLRERREYLWNLDRHYSPAQIQSNIQYTWYIAAYTVMCEDVQKVLNKLNKSSTHLNCQQHKLFFNTIIVQKGRSFTSPPG